MDPLSPISFVYTVSKDLYSFCMIAKGREDDLKDFRAQLLSLREKSVVVEQALKREGIKSEDKSKVVAAVVECEAAAKRLDNSMAKFKQDDHSGQGFIAEMKAGLKSFGRKAVWPVLKPTLEAPVIHLNTCHKSLDGAISILHLNIDITSLEHVRKLDKMMVDGKASLDQGFKDIESSINGAITRSFQQVEEQIVQQTKLMLDDQSQTKAKELVQTLWYQEIEARGRHIDGQSPETDYAWLLTSAAWGIPDALNLVKFLHLEPGLFWISGDPASGKSSLMYYLSNPHRGGRPLWQWHGNTEVTIACHYCWVAGSDMQKSQQALLQSLLYYVLLDNLHLVPQVCQDRWHTWPRKESWSIHELWACLEVAIRTVKKRLCFFIDGLDELQPERDHRQLVRKLLHLATYSNVKIIVSSRPWKAFEGLHIQERNLKMSAINEKAIADYLKNQLSAIEAFADVSWPCLHMRSSCKLPHFHSYAHEIMQDLVSKAEGNFLWITIVTDRICMSMRIYSNDLDHLKKQMNKIPSKVEDLFQDMTLQRPDDDSKCEMAMCLWIALLPSAQRKWIFFWLLAVSGQTGAVSITNLDAELTLVTDHHRLSPITITAMEAMILTTKSFLDYHCRDVLYLDLVHDDSGEERYQRNHLVSFRHRMIFDYCHTQEMHNMLVRVTPPAFNAELFEPCLLLLGSRYYVTEDVVCDVPSAYWWLEAMQGHFWILRKLTTLLVSQSVEDGVYKSSIRKMNKAAERVSQHFLMKCFQLEDRFSSSESDGKDTSAWDDAAVALGVSQDLASLGLYNMLDALLDRIITKLGKHSQVQECFRTLLVCYQHVDARIIKKLLTAGADPNEVYYCLSGRLGPPFLALTPWLHFLRNLAANEEHADKHEDQSVMLETEVTRFFPSPYSPQIVSSVQVQKKIKDLLQSGAELELAPMKHTNSIKVVFFLTMELVWYVQETGSRVNRTLKLSMDAPILWLHCAHDYLWVQTRSGLVCWSHMHGKWDGMRL